MIAFVAGEAEDAFLENGVFFIPKRKREANVLTAVADASEAVFIPAIGAGAGVIVREKFPGVAVGAVVLADRAPGTLTEVGTPALPVFLAGSGLFQTKFFLGHAEHSRRQTGCGLVGLLFKIDVVSARRYRITGLSDRLPDLSVFRTGGMHFGVTRQAFCFCNVEPRAEPVVLNPVAPRTNDVSPSAEDSESHSKSGLDTPLWPSYWRRAIFAHAKLKTHFLSPCF